MCRNGQKFSVLCTSVQKCLQMCWMCKSVRKGAQVCWNVLKCAEMCTSVLPWGLTPIHHSAAACCPPTAAMQHHHPYCHHPQHHHHHHNQDHHCRNQLHPTVCFWAGGKLRIQERDFILKQIKFNTNWGENLMHDIWRGKDIPNCCHLSTWRPLLPGRSRHRQLIRDIRNWIHTRPSSSSSTIFVHQHNQPQLGFLQGNKYLYQIIPANFSPSLVSIFSLCVSFRLW